MLYTYILLISHTTLFVCKPVLPVAFACSLGTFDFIHIDRIDRIAISTTDRRSYSNFCERLTCRPEPFPPLYVYVRTIEECCGPLVVGPAAPVHGIASYLLSAILTSILQNELLACLLACLVGWLVDSKMREGKRGSDFVRRNYTPEDQAWQLLWQLGCCCRSLGSS